ncbi:hypothetical protein [Moorena sp. SIO3A2]|uniref:hypothetical protein n=1 Tax=Moorena sp. SIO3A2 TaxID=2607841 RepID=UPI0013B85C2E|nr:hypothetical protein [Moorena sp. SIO3A2]NER90335.1 hypothetical protein [Moorena sp. SIO3A2]
MNSKNNQDFSEYVAPQVIIPGINLEMYKMPGKSNYKCSQRGTARNYLLSHHYRVAQILESKSFKALLGEEYKVAQIFGETKGGVQQISVLDPEGYAGVGIYQIRYTKNNKQLTRAIELQQAYTASKLIDMADQLFGEKVNPVESFLDFLPGMQILAEELSRVSATNPPHCVGEWLAANGIVDCPISNQRIGQRAAELRKALTGQMPEKKTVRVPPNGLQVKANTYPGLNAALIGVAYRTLIAELQTGVKGPLWHDEDGMLCLRRDLM